MMTGLDIERLDDLARQDTPLHRLDARVKIGVTLAFIVVVASFPRHAVTALTPFFLFPSLLVAMGGLPVGFLLRRLLAVAPLVLLLAASNLWLDRQTVVSWGPLAITGGALSSLSLLLRLMLTVSAVLATVACTGMPAVAAGLQRMGVPDVFVMQLVFLYRYLFLLVDQGGRMRRAASLRGGGRAALPWRCYPSLLGHLLLRSAHRSERVYHAMLARGFSGVWPALQKTTPAWRDAVFAAGWLAFFAVARRWDLAAGLGSLLVRHQP